MDNTVILTQVLNSFQDSAIRERSYYPDFRRKWEALLKKAAELEAYYDFSAPSVLTVEQSFAGIDASFHFDQLKIADWYRQDSGRKKRVVFKPERLKHSKRGGLSFHDSPCDYDPSLPESALTDDMKNIVAAALPELPPRLRVVYGNKWVNGRFNPFLTTKLSLFLIETDYVPAFLGSPFEVCLYLFMMDYCIIKENYSKVKDDDLKQFLHIFRPSPMLKIKGIL
jgi:hypothetical protein